MLLLLLFCFLIVFLILLIFRWNTSKEIFINKDFKTYNEELFELDSGDLVFVAYNNMLGKASKLWNGSKWTHVGIAYRNVNDQLSILEVADYNNPNFEKGVIQVPIKSWLEMNKHCEITYRKFRDKNIEDINPEDLYTLFLKYKDKKLHKFGVNPQKWKKYLFPLHEDKTSLSCNEFVCKIFEDLNFIPKDSYYSTPELMNIKL
jgi:hypothetical protein